MWNRIWNHRRTSNWKIWRSFERTWFEIIFDRIECTMGKFSVHVGMTRVIDRRIKKSSFCTGRYHLVWIGVARVRYHTSRTANNVLVESPKITVTQVLRWWEIESPVSLLAWHKSRESTGTRKSSLANEWMKNKWMNNEQQMNEWTNNGQTMNEQEWTMSEQWTMAEWMNSKWFRNGTRRAIEVWLDYWPAQIWKVQRLEAGTLSDMEDTETGAVTSPLVPALTEIWTEKSIDRLFLTPAQFWGLNISSLSKSAQGSNHLF